VDPETGAVDWDKPPVNARTGALASSTNPRTWSTFDEALAAYERGGLDGVGLVLHKEKGDEGPGLVGIDLDKCRDPQTGAVEPWALEVVNKINSYTELSPSGTGLRIFLRGKLPPNGRKKGPYENYEWGRYVTVTGRHVEGTPPTVEDRQEQLLEVHRGVWPPEDRQRPTPPASALPATQDDAEIIRKARQSKNGAKFGSLWDGSIAGYPSASEADLALTNYLAFWCGPDPERIDALFRSSGLFRSKWNREDYRQGTIRKALENRTEFYDWGRTGRRGRKGVRGHSVISFTLEVR
jgi:primase-polymerase (primpol)-like protein